MPQNPTIEAAAVAGHQALMERVYQPTFFSKLAEYGIVPQSEDEVVRLLDMASKLAAAAEQAAVAERRKQASLIEVAASRLDAALGVRPQANAEAALDDYCKRAAAEWLADPTVGRTVADAAAAVGRYQTA